MNRQKVKENGETAKLARERAYTLEIARVRRPNPPFSPPTPPPRDIWLTSFLLEINLEFALRFLIL